MNIEDKALDIILDHTASSEWEDVCELTWNTDEVQELLIKALKQGQTLPIDSVIVPKGTLRFHLEALTKEIEDSHSYGFDDVLSDYLKRNAL